MANFAHDAAVPVQIFTPRSSGSSLKSSAVTVHLADSGTLKLERISSVYVHSRERLCAACLALDSPVCQRVQSCTHSRLVSQQTSLMPQKAMQRLLCGPHDSFDYQAAIDLHSGPDLDQGFLAKLNRKVSDMHVSLVADCDEEDALGPWSDDSEGSVSECCLCDDDGDRAELDL